MSSDQPLTRNAPSAIPVGWLYKGTGGRPWFAHRCCESCDENRAEAGDTPLFVEPSEDVDA